MKIVWENLDISLLLVSIFNWQTLPHFCNPPLEEFIDTDTSDILGHMYL